MKPIITFSKLGRKGRLGNQLFHINSMIGLAEKYGYELRLPPWKYSQYFNCYIGEYTGITHQSVVEPNYHYDPDFFDNQLKADRSADVNGWLQTAKYFGSETLTFRADFLDKVRAKYKHLFDKPTIAISIRRGDFVGNENYFQLPITYYILALFEHFPDWQDHNLVFFSDDINYCKLHFACLDNAFFSEGSDIEQLCLGSMCNNYIISNSTFSWWMAYMGSRNATVIRPKKNIDGPLEQRSNEKDYWIESWKVFNHEGKKINLKDATFLIPVHHDHNDRKQNLELSICMLQKDFDTHIIITEQGSETFGYMGQWATYVKFDYKEFHRTRMLNDMTGIASTPIVINYDCDNVIAPMQLWLSVEKIRKGAHMVYPFDGQSARVPRVDHFRKLEKYLDAGIFGSLVFKGMGKYDSVGHAVVMDKQSFCEAGMENEYMISWAPEDTERYERFTRLGYKVERIRGAVYHIDHYTGVNSSKSNPHYEANFKVLEKIRRMSDEDLRKYVETWPWTHPYTESYYEGIVENAIRSRDEVFKVLPIKFKSIIDIGCGIGEWGTGLDEKGIDYFGVDHKIPLHKLLIDKSKYQDFDLEGGFYLMTSKKFDLCICLEVAEHLYESKAEKLIDILCGTSDYVLFSAAIPQQGGLDHKNEQWQTWWEKLFNENGYYASEEPFRDKIKDNKNIEIWYRNNMVLYSKHFKGKVQDYVLPELFEQVVSHYINLKTA